MQEGGGKMQEPEAEVEVRGLVGREGLVVTTRDGRGRLATSTPRGALRVRGGEIVSKTTHK